MAKTAVVILNYNGRKYLEQFLPGVIENSKNSDVYVADNASSDDSVHYLKTEFPDLKLIQLDQNHGFAGGYNEALKHIESEYYLLLNSDVEVTSGWIEPLEVFLDEHADYAACQPKIKDYNNKSDFEYAGACGGYIDFMGYPYCRGRILNSLEKDEGQYDEEVDIFWSSGACMLVRSQVFRDAGGFDRDFFAHMEEIDLCWRIHSLGYKIKSVPSSTVFHVGGGTLDKTSPFKTYLNFRNGLSLLVKNLPMIKLILKLPARLILDWVALTKFFFEGKPNHSSAVLKAHWAFVRKIKRDFDKRLLISKAPKSKFLIFEYYLLGRKKFSDL